MSEEKPDTDSSPRPERRSGKDRRQTDRRDTVRNGDDKGILSTRKADRRKGGRRKEDLDKK